MINGKFYTGLPPKMVDRQCGTGLNRQETHFFWPDDTQVDSAVETRVKRRTSLTLEPTERPRLAKRLSAVLEPEVDTRQMFHKEFAKSSIQFYDNLQDKRENSGPMLRRAQRREVTPKLTTIAYSEPAKSVVDEAYTTAKRNQAYTSKIQFYDYVNEADSTPAQNNARRPKMDMNDKRDVERNTKNSPKLQVKRNVRNLSLERELYTPERDLSEISHNQKPSNDGAESDIVYNGESDKRRPMLLPKKILKHRIQPAVDESDAILDFVDNGVRQLQLRGAPSKKHVTYSEEAAEYAYYDDRDERSDRAAEGRRQLTNMRTGSGQQQQRQQQQQSQRPYGETSRSSGDDVDLKSLNNHNNKSSHNNYASNRSVYNNNSYGNESTTSTRKNLPKLPETTTTTNTRRSYDTRSASASALASTEQPPSDPRKHLRSSLCFNGDALIVNVGAAAQRRSAARNSANARVSVGLPD